MFKFFKEKLKTFFTKKTEEIEEKVNTEIKENEISAIKAKIEEKDLKLIVQDKKKELEKLDIKLSSLKESDKETKNKDQLKEAEKAEEKIKEKIEEKKQEIEEIAEIEKQDEEIIEKKGFFSRLKEKFISTKLSDDDFDDIFKDLEIVLLQNNVALVVVDEIKKKLRDELVDKSMHKKEIEDNIKAALKNAVSDILLEPFDVVERIKEKKEGPFVIAFFGINGSGKTTSIAKLAHLLQKNRLKVVLAAADTFRAASIEQLEKHASKLDVNVIKNQYGSDPASVAFDAIKHAKAKGIDVVLIDTAGRMHTKADLMKEMEKIVKVSKPDLKIFVAESITGNDAVDQAKAFNDSIKLDGIILTKADVDEKGGTMISVSKVTGKPILYLGVGQEYGDLELFDKKKILDSLF